LYPVSARANKHALAAKGLFPAFLRFWQKYKVRARGQDQPRFLTEFSFELPGPHPEYPANSLIDGGRSCDAPRMYFSTASNRGSKMDAFRNRF